MKTRERNHAARARSIAGHGGVADYDDIEAEVRFTVYVHPRGQMFTGLIDGRRLHAKKLMVETMCNTSFDEPDRRARIGTRIYGETPDGCLHLLWLVVPPFHEGSKPVYDDSRKLMALSPAELLTQSTLLSTERPSSAHEWAASASQPMLLKRARVRRFTVNVNCPLPEFDPDTGSASADRVHVENVVLRGEMPYAKRALYQPGTRRLLHPLADVAHAPGECTLSPVEHRWFDLPLRDFIDKAVADHLKRHFELVKPEAALAS